MLYPFGAYDFAQKKWKIYWELILKFLKQNLVPNYEVD